MQASFALPAKTLLMIAGVTAAEVQTCSAHWDELTGQRTVVGPRRGGVVGEVVVGFHNDGYLASWLSLSSAFRTSHTIPLANDRFVPSIGKAD
ncbi:MAG: hypothetical protein ACRBM6_18115 [Geminicoccales bacterium]